MKKSLSLYVFVLIVFGLGIFFTLERGQRLPPRPVAQVQETSVAAAPAPAAAVAVAPPKTASSSPSLWAGLNANLQEPLSRLFVQLLVVLLATRAVGALFARIGQPSVVGEMFAGILLGPSLLGLLFPGAFQFVFPVASLGTLKLLSQIGVCLFMFVVGMELDLDHLRSKAHTAVVVSHASILFPYFLGVSASLVLFATLAGPGVSFVSFALFMGISMSITAFPVLARILQERGMEKTALGTTAITCAAVDDVTAWSILAFIVAIVRSTGMASTVFSLSLVLVFVALMLWVIRPLLLRLLDGAKQGNPGKGTLATVLGFAFTAALTTEVVGIHALFGAFLAGVVMPLRPEFRQYVRVRIENFASIFLLPLFFAFTGLRTQIGLINNAEGWMFCLGIICIATIGKLGGSMLTARLTGLGWNDSFVLGALMNTRGLMELIAINIGYDLGILSPQIFAMLVLMALVTTFLTGPLLAFAEMIKRRHALVSVH